MRHTIIAILLVLCTAAAYSLGSSVRQKEIESRVFKIDRESYGNKECYSNQEIEYIVFGESQE